MMLGPALRRVVAPASRGLAGASFAATAAPLASFARSSARGLATSSQRLSVSATQTSDGVDWNGVDGWSSSGVHRASELAETVEENRDAYSKWAANYDAEMAEHDLQSFKSVTSKFFEVLNLEGKTEVSVLDAGCGTGILGQHLKAELAKKEPALKVQLTGIDLSPHMLEQASKKECFDQLQTANMKEPMSLGDESFDYVVSSGVFLAGHCGPEAVPNILATLKHGGLAIFTVRESLFAKQKQEFTAAISSAGCTLVEAPLMAYYGEVQANVVVAQKGSVH